MPSLSSFMTDRWGCVDNLMHLLKPSSKMSFENFQLVPNRSIKASQFRIFFLFIKKSFNVTCCFLILSNMYQKSHVISGQICKPFLRIQKFIPFCLKNMHSKAPKIQNARYQWYKKWTLSDYFTEYFKIQEHVC